MEQPYTQHRKNQGGTVSEQPYTQYRQEHRTATPSSLLGFDVDDAVLKRVQDKYAVKFKSDYDLDYDQERMANGLLPSAYDKNYDDTDLDRFLWNNNLPSSKDIMDFYNDAAAELEKEAQEAYEKEAPAREYNELLNAFGQDLTGYLDEEGNLSRERVLQGAYAAFEDGRYANLYDKWSEYKEDDGDWTEEEILRNQIEQADPNTYNIERLFTELDAAHKKAKTAAAQEQREAESLARRKAEWQERMADRPFEEYLAEQGISDEPDNGYGENIPILNTKAFGGYGSGSDTTTQVDIERQKWESAQREAEEAEIEARREEQDAEFRAMVDTSGQRNMPGGFGTAGYNIYNEEIQAQTDAYVQAKLAEGMDAFELDNILRRNNMGMYMHRDGANYSAAEVENYVRHNLELAGYSLEESDAYIAALDEAEWATFEADMEFDNSVHSDIGRDIGRTIVSIPVRAVVDTAAGIVGFADMLTGWVIDGDENTDNGLWAATEWLNEQSYRWQQYGHSETHESMNVISDVGAELFRMLALHTAGVGLAGKVAGKGAAAAQAMTAGQKGMGTILRSFLTKAAKSAPFITNAMGSYFTQAMGSGATRGEAASFAVLAGTFEGVLEGVGADAMFNRAFSAGLVNRMMAGSKSMLTSPWAFKGVQVAASALGNGIEEGASYWISGLLERAIYNPEWQANAEEFWESFGMGALIGSTGAMFGSARDTRSRAIFEELCDKGFDPQLFDEGMNAVVAESMPESKYEARIQGAMEMTQDEFRAASGEKFKQAQIIENAQQQRDTQVAQYQTQLKAAENKVAALTNKLKGAKDNATRTSLFNQLADAKRALAKLQGDVDAKIAEAEKAYEQNTSAAQSALNVANRRIEDHAIAADLRAQVERAQAEYDGAAQELSAAEQELSQLVEGAMLNPEDDAQDIAIEAAENRVANARAALSSAMENHEALAQQNAATQEAWANDAEWQAELQRYAQMQEAPVMEEQPQRTMPSAEEQAAAWAKVQEIAQQLDVNVVRADADLSAQLGLQGDINGKYQDGNIYIRSDVSNPVMGVFKHELTHYIESSRFYDQFREFVGKAFGDDLEAVIAGVQASYLEASNGRIRLDRDGAYKELVADFVKDKLLSDQQSINALVRMQKTPARGIYNWIRYTIDRFNARRDPAMREIVKAERMFRKAFSDAEPDSRDAQYSANLEQVQREYQQAVDHDLVDFIEEAQVNKDIKPYRLKPVSDRAAADIMRVIGVDARGFSTAYEWKQVKHVIRDHGPNGRADHSMENPEDMARVQYVLDNYDSMVDGGKVSGYKEQKPGTQYNRGARSVKYEKRINGTYYVIEAVPDAERKTAFIVSTYKTKKGANPITDAEAPVLNARSWSGSAPSNGSVPQQADAMQGENATFQGQADIGLHVDDLIAKYGRIPQGENPARDIAFPRKISDDLSVSRFARTAGEASALNEEQAARLQEEVKEGRIGSYVPYANQAAIDDAKSTIALNGMTGAMQRWKAVVNGSHVASKADIALGEVLLSEYAAMGDTDTTMELVADLCIEATRAGQAVQAFSLLKKFTPAGKLYYMERMVQKLNQQYEKQIKKGKMQPLVLSDAVKQELLAAKSKAEVQAAEEHAAQEIGQQIPTTFADGLTAWRYFAMLGNPRTHIRNILGNAAMYGLSGLKDAIATGIEGVVLSEDQRTKSVLTPEDKALRNYAKSTWEEGGKELTMAGGKLGFEDMVQKNRKMFNVKWLEKASRFNSNALEAEDIFFSSRAYSRAFAEAMKARGLTADTITSDQRQEIMNHAADEARRVTFRDYNKLSSLLNEIENSSKTAKVLVGGAVPFKKTPLNVLKRGVEYSPVGLAQGIYEVTLGVKKGNYTAAEGIDRIASGTVGTGLLGLGMLLAKLGLVRGSGEEEEDYEYYLQDLGEQTYALQLGDTSYTIDWLAPASIPLFMGVELMSAMENQEGFDFDAVVSAMSQASDPLMQLSMLQGINDILESGQEEGLGGALGAAAVTAGRNYLTQYVPSAFGQIARTIDPTRRTNTGDPNAPWGKDTDYVLRKTANKIPFVSRTQEAYIDKWGREEINGNHWAVRLLENMVFPWYSSERNYTEVDTELTRLYMATGNASALPTQASRRLVSGDQSYQLTAEEFTQYKKEVGQAVFEAVDRAMASGAYRGRDDEDRAEMIEKAIGKAESRVREEWKRKVGLKD